MKHDAARCFWEGGFIRYAAVFMSGVMFTLLVIGVALAV